MKVKVINSQLNNLKTYQMYRRQCMTLAENVFKFRNLPTYIDKAFLNKELINSGSIAFFVDEVMGLLALPYLNISSLDVYGRPRKIQVIGKNGYKRILKENEFVIMYDNNGRYPLWFDIIQYAERLALDTRTIDININQQKTPRFWKCQTGKEKTIQDKINNIDSFNDIIISYDENLLDDTDMILSPAPFVADKIDIHKEKIWNEFLRLIGVSNMSFQKKERNIRDEIQASQGGTIASRFSRFEPRKDAIEEINKKLGNIILANGQKAIENEIMVSYYDDEPTTEEKETDETDFFENGDDENA